MAKLAISETDELLLRLTPWEKLGAVHGDLRVPLRSVRAVSVVAEPWKSLHGLRAPDTRWPGLIMLDPWKVRQGLRRSLPAATGFGPNDRSVHILSGTGQSGLSGTGEDGACHHPWCE